MKKVEFLSWYKRVTMHDLLTSQRGIFWPVVVLAPLVQVQKMMLLRLFIFPLGSDSDILASFLAGYLVSCGGPWQPEAVIVPVAATSGEKIFFPLAHNKSPTENSHWLIRSFPHLKPQSWGQAPHLNPFLWRKELDFPTRKLRWYYYQNAGS